MQLKTQSTSTNHLIMVSASAELHVVKIHFWFFETEADPYVLLGFGAQLSQEL